MKKQLALLKNHVQVALTFRGELWLWFVLDAAPLTVLLIVWSSLYQGVASYDGISLSQMVFYYLVTYIIAAMTTAHFEEWRVSEIRGGKIDMYLTKPIHYLTQVFSQFLAGKSIYMLLTLPFFLLFTWGCFTIFNVVPPTLSLSMLPPVLVLLIFAFLLNYAMSLGIVLLGFWFENAEGLQHFKWAIVSILSGAIIPLQLMPTQLQQVADALPFKYLLAVPAGVLLSQYTLKPTDCIYMGLTLAGCTIVLRLVWKRAQFRYASSGG